MTLANTQKYLKCDTKKECRKCNDVKFLSEFSFHKTGRFKTRSHCKACECQHAREYRKKFPERVIESKKRYIKKYGGLSEIYKKEKEKAKKRQKRYRNTLKGRFSLQKSKSNRRALEAGAGGSFTLIEWEMLCKHYSPKNMCLNCKKQDLALTVDHVVPLNKQGNNYISNIQPLCKSCNCSKQDKIIDYRLDSGEFARSLMEGR